ncbi:MAG: hypothetical protein FWE04_01715 [Oscillospiraceae bacterium]|nr:hypothetical protein [Oscillospiraceae bacterium]
MKKISLFSFYFTKDYAAISADSRQSVFENGQYFKVHDNAQKLYKINDLIIAGAGRYYIIDKVIEEFSALNPTEQTPEILRQTALSICDRKAEILKALNMDESIIEQELESNEKSCEFCVFTYDMERQANVYYNFHSGYDFEVTEQVGDDRIALACAGYNNVEANRLFKELHDKHSSYLPLLFKKVYEGVSDGTVGGKLIFIEMNNGIITNEQEIKLTDNKPIRSLNLINELGGDNVITWINNRFENRSKVAGIDVHGNGIVSYDQSENVRFRVRPDDGVVEMFDMFLIMRSGNNTIIMNPNDGMAFQTNNADRLRFDITNGILTLTDGTINSCNINGGNINVDTDMTIGNNLRISASTFGQGIHFDNAGGARIDVQDPFTGWLNISNGLTVNGQTVATQQWVTQQIQAALGA